MYRCSMPVSIVGPGTAAETPELIKEACELYGGPWPPPEATAW